MANRNTVGQMSYYSWAIPFPCDHRNLMKALEQYPALFKGCVPIKPSVAQKCSKRSWMQACA